MDSDYGVPRELSEVQKNRTLYQPEVPPCLQVRAASSPITTATASASTPACQICVTAIREAPDPALFSGRIGPVGAWANGSPASDLLGGRLGVGDLTRPSLSGGETGSKRWWTLLAE